MRKLQESIKQIRDQTSIVKAKMDTLETKVNNIDKQVLSQINQLDLLDLKAKEHVLRFRAIAETPKEQTRGRMVAKLATFLQKDRQWVDSEIDKAFRVNSQFASLNKLSRDILIHFVRKNTRDMILQHHSKNKFQIDNKDVIV